MNDVATLEILRRYPSNATETFDAVYPVISYGQLLNLMTQDIEFDDTRQCQHSLCKKIQLICTLQKTVVINEDNIIIYSVFDVCQR